MNSWTAGDGYLCYACGSSPDHDVVSAKDPPAVLKAGSAGALKGFDSDGDFVVQTNSHPVNHTSFLQDAPQAVEPAAV
eukprot:351135-Alexandrium_andersonii.AAC.1